MLLLELLVVRLMEQNSIGVTFFDKVQDLLADNKDCLVPFALYVVSLLMMYCGKYFSRAKNAVRNFEIGIKILASFQFQVQGFADFDFHRFESV